MTYEELADATVTAEIGDVHAAHVIMNETRGMHKELRMYRVAQILAKLREYYVEVGRKLEHDTPTPRTDT